MSIYATWLTFADDECADHTTGCTCPCGPICYQGSHIFPSDDDMRQGIVTLCAIPGFLTAAGYDDSHEHGQTVQPWLRLGVNDEVVLLDLRQVQEVHHTLADWLARVRQQP